MRYHRKFRHFKPSILTTTKQLVKNWGTSTEVERWQKMLLWVEKAAEIYSIPKPTLVSSPTAGYGFYSPSTNKIYMNTASIVTVIHEFRHALQSQNRASGFNNDPTQVEHDARGWSLSLYYKVAPRSFRRLVANGSIFHISVNDLTRG